MTTQTTSSTTRRVILTLALAVAVSTLLAGGAAAHNPACHQTAGEDGPHYDDDPQTGSNTAFEKNPTLGGDYNEEAAGSCGASNPQSSNGGGPGHDE